MQVPEQVLTVWKDNFDKGDREPLSKELGVSVVTVSKYLSGEAPFEAIQKITDYFQRKQQEIIDQANKK